MHLRHPGRGSDAIGDAGRADGFDELTYIRDRLDAVRKKIRQAGIPALDEVGAKPNRGRLFDFFLHRNHAAARKILAAIFEVRREASGGQPFGEAPIGKVFGIDQDPVAVENDQFWNLH